MRRVFAWSIPLLLIAIGLLWPLLTNSASGKGLPADDPVVFSNFQADFVVNADGRLDAVETITAEFPGGRHGLFRWWPTTTQKNRFARQIPDVTSVTVDGAPAPYRMLWEDGRRFRVAKIGQSYPQLNSSNNFLNLQDNLADTENKLAFARQYYNDAVATVNGLLSNIPWMFVAPLTGVSEREYYQTPR